MGRVLQETGEEESMVVLSGKTGPQQGTLESTGLLRGRSGLNQSACMGYSHLLFDFGLVSLASKT